MIVFNANNEFIKHKHLHGFIITEIDYYNNLINWVNKMNENGHTKKQIYNVLLIFHVHLQANTGPNEKFHNRLTDFLDLFTAWGKSSKILPNQPDIE